MLSKWDKRFLELAKHVSEWSKDPGTKVGAVIVDDMNRIISMGYNGFPRDIVDFKERLDDREIKLKLTLHAEENAILFANRDLTGTTIYTYPFQPCSHCSLWIVQSGIGYVVAPKSDVERWKDDFKLAEEILAESGVQLTLQ